MIHLSQMFVQNIGNATFQLTQLRNKTVVTSYGRFPLANDYLCWLHNALFSDYSTVTYLLTNMPDIDCFDLRPVYCILRSSLEKYADILNLFMKRDLYYAYLIYLNSDSTSRALKSTGDKEGGERFRKEADQNIETVKKNFNVTKCNRLTRYYLLGDFNSLPAIQNMPNILEFNRTLFSIDSKFSQLLHNNIETFSSNNFEKSYEILKYTHYMMYISLCLLELYYQMNFPEIASSQYFLLSLINDLKTNQALAMLL